MSNYTEYYNLKKPAQSENYNVDDANTNNTIIDTVLYEKVDKIPGKGLSTNDFTDGYKKKIDSMQTLYRFKGTVITIDDLSLIENRNIGDTYKCEEDNNNYIWNGQDWLNIGEDVDYSEILNKLDLYQQETNQKIESLNDEINSQIDNVKSTKYTLTIAETTETGAEITLPCYYKVGQGTLDVYLNGERVILSSDEAGTDGHYQEVGELDSISNKIKTTTDWNLEAGDVLDLVVRGDYCDTES